ncbi:MAG TPA: GNAT family N-acetyltransferase [Solirubrobacteraceae bacterium]
MPSVLRVTMLIVSRRRRTSSAKQAVRTTRSRRLAEQHADAGWLRFTRVDWDGAPIAYHFGISFRGSFLWY